MNIKTRNPSHGFYGTVGANAEAVWVIALEKIANATGQPAEAVCAFLDSDHGREFARAVAFEMGSGRIADLAVARAVERMLAVSVCERIGNLYTRYSKDPRAEYLTTMVVYYGKRRKSPFSKKF